MAIVELEGCSHVRGGLYECIYTIFIIAESLYKVTRKIFIISATIIHLSSIIDTHYRE